MLTCGHEPSKHSEHTTGYGTDREGRTFCYECLASIDTGAMLKDGHSRRLPLYLTSETPLQRGHGAAFHQGTGRQWSVGNWPGSLRFPVRHAKIGSHNIAGRRYDVWFDGPDGYVWHGTQYGDWTMVVHCKRTRERAA